MPNATTTLSQALDKTRRLMRAAGSTSAYENIAIGDAIQLFGNDFARITRCTKQLSTIAATIDSAALDFSGVDHFEPDLMRNLYIAADANFSAAQVKNQLTKIGIDDMLEEQACNGSSSGVPTSVAFTSFVAATTNRPFKTSCTLNCLWTPPFTRWTPGQAQVTATISGGAVTGITIQNGGTYASATPAVTFSGGGGTGATATVTVAKSTYGDYAITAFSITGAGTGYTAAPTVLIDGIDCSTPIVLNIQDDMIDGVLQWGASVGVQMNQIENVEGDKRFAAYINHREACRGRGSLSGDVSYVRPRGYSRGSSYLLGG